LTVNPKYYFCSGVGVGAAGTSTELGIIVLELGAV
jgi:hypothetical protein